MPSEVTCDGEGPLPVFGSLSVWITAEAARVGMGVASWVIVAAGVRVATEAVDVTVCADAVWVATGVPEAAVVGVTEAESGACCTVRPAAVLVAVTVAMMAPTLGAGVEIVAVGAAWVTVAGLKGVAVPLAVPVAAVVGAVATSGPTVRLAIKPLPASTNPTSFGGRGPNWSTAETPLLPCVVIERMVIGLASEVSGGVEAKPAVVSAVAAAASPLLIAVIKRRTVAAPLVCVCA